MNFLCLVPFNYNIEKVGEIVGLKNLLFRFSLPIIPITFAQHISKKLYTKSYIEKKICHFFLPTSLFSNNANSDYVNSVIVNEDSFVGFGALIDAQELYLENFVLFNHYFLLGQQLALRFYIRKSEHFNPKNLQIYMVLDEKDKGRIIESIEFNFNLNIIIINLSDEDLKNVLSKYILKIKYNNKTIKYIMPGMYSMGECCLKLKNSFDEIANLMHEDERPRNLHVFPYQKNLYFGRVQHYTIDLVENRYYFKAKRITNIASRIKYPSAPTIINTNVGDNRLVVYI